MNGIKTSICDNFDAKANAWIIQWCSSDFVYFITKEQSFVLPTLPLAACIFVTTC